jgi:hypothetical protein
MISLTVRIFYPYNHSLVFATRKCYMLLYLHCLFMEVFQRPLVLFLFVNQAYFPIADAKVRQKSESASVLPRKMHEIPHFLHFYRLRKRFWELNSFLHLFIFTCARHMGGSGLTEWFACFLWPTMVHSISQPQEPGNNSAHLASELRRNSGRIPTLSRP